MSLRGWECNQPVTLTLSLQCCLLSPVDRSKRDYGSKPDEACNLPLGSVFPARVLCRKLATAEHPPGGGEGGRVTEQIT